MISGTTALTGCADGGFVLHEKGRGTREAVLYCTGRDIESKEIELVFDKNDHRWKRTEPVESQPDESIIFVDRVTKCNGKKLYREGQIDTVVYNRLVQKIEKLQEIGKKK